MTIEVRATARAPLGMPAAKFLRDYWQKKPLLVRGAFPADLAPLQPEDLAGLACEEVALSRLVTHDRGTDRYALRSGPFDEALFPTLGDRDWTLLVQDVDKWDADVAALADAFAFLPRWRIDDVMVSFAATGGSVGAHVDQYDVFLVQGLGRRRWQIDASPGPPGDFRDDAELKLLRVFTPDHDWIVEPGDMLYLPPGVPHHGVALEPCLTYSLGMRAPSVAELMVDYVETLAEGADDAQRYGDAGMAPAADRDEIDAAAMARVVEALNAVRMQGPDALGDWFGRFITRYRAAGVTTADGSAAPSRIELEWSLREGAILHRHPWTRTAWRRTARGATLFVAGESFALPLRDARALAAARSLDGAAYAALGAQGRDLVSALLAEGHYRLAPDAQAS